MSDPLQMPFDVWVEIGLRRGWVTPPLCHTHDGIATTPDEDQAFEDGDDPCIHIMRLYATPQEKADCEENHSPTVYRNPFPELRPVP